MADNKKPKGLKRSRVRKLGFDGEEKFMVATPGVNFFMMVGPDGGKVPLLTADDAPGVPVITPPSPPITPGDGGPMPPVLSPGDGGGVKDPPVLLQAPDWNALDCASIQSELAGIRNLLDNGKLTPDAVAFYTQQYELGKQAASVKCAVTPAPAPGTTTITTTGVPVIATPGGGGILGGGGGGAKTAATAPKSDNSWIWWVLGGLAVLYFWGSKKKS